MNRIRIYVYSIIASLALICGCLSDKNVDNDTNVYTNTTTNVTVRAFNDQVYVWEHLHFSTNKVNEIRR